jgi:nitrite reductase (NO-forming)
MFEMFGFIKYVLLQGVGLVISLVVAAIFIYIILRKLHSLRMTVLLFLFFFGTFLFVYVPIGLPNGIEYPFALKTYGPGQDPGLPLKNVMNFFGHIKSFDRIDDIARDPNDIPPPISRTQSETVKIHLTTKEVLAEMGPGITFNYWTFDGTIPGPFLRVREGDTVELTLENDKTSLHHHNIDLHAVTGPGGGAVVTDVAPGESKLLTFKALNPGLFVYHCAHTNPAQHMAHGMYGMILVEPKEGMPKVDKEFYVMQGEFYTASKMGVKGLQVFDAQQMLDGHPEYIVLNGKLGGVGPGKMNAAVGERIRMYFGNGGVNMVSSFHMIGEIFDTVYPEGSMGGALLKNVQTTIVPAGGATIAELGLEYPGKSILVDHALARIDRGAWGVLTITGSSSKDIYDGEFPLPAVTEKMGH